jgi:putative heme iron utilization protein
MKSEQALDENAIAGITSHMNDDHSEALVLYLHAYAKIDADGIADVQMMGIDQTGIDISYSVAGTSRIVRIDFADCGFNKKVDSRAAARAMLVDMVNAASV